MAPLQGRTEPPRLNGTGDYIALTGLVNRRGFSELFEVELERARRFDRALCVAVGDVDHFRALNDRLGHRADDRALRLLAEVLTGATRRIDAVARIGGEEFALIMPDSDEHDGWVTAERVRREVRDALGPEFGGVTISFGIASHPRHGDEPDALLHASDEALYAAKELGRDRSVIHTAEIAGTLRRDQRRGASRRDAYLATVVTLAEALDLRDADVGEHSRDVGHYAGEIARELRLPGELVERVRIGGTVHDEGTPRWGARPRPRGRRAGLTPPVRRRRWS